MRSIVQGFVLGALYFVLCSPANFAQTLEPFTCEQSTKHQAQDPGQRLNSRSGVHILDKSVCHLK